MKRSGITPLNSARPFSLEELFFSTTDRKGIITGCNGVFVDIAAYESEELLAKAHNAIRHPDMPRCVFKLLWDYLLSDKPIGAYVKNMAKTGEYYWVYALVMPIPDGFLSVRLKPTSEIFSTVQTLYKKLLKEEREYGKEWKEGMNSSLQTLHQAITELGFDSYDEFMSRALQEEIHCRKATLEREQAMQYSSEKEMLYSVFEGVGHLNKLQQNLNAQKTFFGDLGFNVSRVALNASVVATRLSDAGRALSVISEEVSHVANQITSESRTFEEQVNLLTDILHQTSFMVSFCTLLVEMIEFLDRESSDISDEQEEIRRFGKSLTQHAGTIQAAYQEFLTECISNIKVLKNVLGEFGCFSEALSKILLNLQLGYVTGQSIAIGVKGGQSFSALLDELFKASEEARAELESLKQAASSVEKQVSQWQHLERLSDTSRVSP